MADRSGETIASKYRLEALLGSGGMGHVYRATNVRAGRAVAIKILRPEHATNTIVVERFLREAMAANLVRHPNVVDVVDVDKDEDGSPFIVQELLAGEDLAKYVETRGGRLTVAELEELILPVIDALAEAHARGVVHRDIKPENVFLAQQNGKRVPKLLDFGISKIQSSGTKTTAVGMMMGTPAYMSPEQVQGSREADPRTDVWAMGVMLFELLAGRLPFDEQDAPALFVAIATRDVPSVRTMNPGVDAKVAKLIERCLRRDAAERYPSARELARDFRHVMSGAEPEPTQQAAVDAPPLDIPDLALPLPSRPVPRKQEPPAAPTHVGNFEFGEAELPSARPPAPMPTPTPSPMMMTIAEPPDLELGSSSYSAPPSQPMRSAPSSHRASEPLPGMMFGGSVAPSQRRPAGLAPFASAPQPLNRPNQDFSGLIALGVVGLVSVFVTAILMTFLYDPDGWPVLGYVTKPSPDTNMIAQGILSVAAVGISVKLGITGVRRWNAHIEGARGTAVFFAVLTGAFLFAAVQLGRAAF